MMKIFLKLILFYCFVLITGKVILAEEIIWEDIGCGSRNIQTVLFNRQKPQELYFGSDQGIFNSTDGGKEWNNVLSLKGKNRTVYALVYAEKDKSSIYAAAENGLYFSSDRGKTWKRIFQGGNAAEKDCRALAVNENYVYLGTRAGLFVSADRGRFWKKQTGVLGYSNILSIVFNKDRTMVYSACLEGLFRKRNDSWQWDRVFTVIHSENVLENNNEEREAEIEEEKFWAVRSVAADPNNNALVYLAVNSGVFKSENNGQTWQRLTSQGLLEKEVKTIIVGFDSQLYCATRTKIFLFRENKWLELSTRLICGEINSLLLDNNANIYTASSKGLFRSINGELAGKERTKNSGEGNFLDDGPAIAEVQLAAMKYAEVEPEKIENWRKQAAKRAILPKVTVSMDTDRNRTVSNSIWGTYSSYSSVNVVSVPGRYYVGPDDETRYRNNNWGVSLTWDFGDLIWNADQTSIDVRSRLMVQLRNDILDEVTKLYFERIRVKAELKSLDIGDKKKKPEKELRIRELNAYLDGFTGGYFSSHIK